MTHQEIVKKYLPADARTSSSGRLIICETSPTTLIRECLHLLHTEELPLMHIHAERVASDMHETYHTFGIPRENTFIVLHTKLGDAKDFPSLAPQARCADVFERRIYETFGLIPAGFPTEIHPVTSHAKRNEPFFHPVLGEGVYEVPVGPVHAGIIEPGHFRFSMLGESIVQLDPLLGWVRKGSEHLFTELPLHDLITLSERIAGDTSFAHSSAFLEALEELLGVTPSPRTRYLRAIFIETERITNHLNDIGFIMSDTGYNFGGSQSIILRERLMQLAEKLTGSRFLRGVNAIGNTTRDLMPSELESISKELLFIKKELTSILDVASGSVILEDRLRGTGVLSRAMSLEYGALGVPARASGVDRDTRKDFPSQPYKDLFKGVVIEKGGDVEARFHVRTREVFASIALIEEAIRHIPECQKADTSGELTLRPNAHAVGVTEGWRGEILYFVSTDKAGKVSRVSVRDPSLANWQLIPLAAPGNVLLDFPLINKSFNLSYTGHDL